MIGRLGTVIYWVSLLATVTFSIAVYTYFVQEIPASVSDCVLSEEDERLYGGDFVSADLNKMSSEGINCLYERRNNTRAYTEYGAAPFYWLLGLLIALTGYSIRFILTGIKNPLPWVVSVKNHD